MNVCVHVSCVYERGKQTENVCGNDYVRVYSVKMCVCGEVAEKKKMNEQYTHLSSLLAVHTAIVGWGPRGPRGPIRCRVGV